MALGKLKHQIELGNLQNISSNNLKYIAGLDVLRAFAVGFVIITHWGPHTLKSPPLNKVILFFLLIDVAGSLIFTGLYGNSSKYLLIPCFIAFSMGGLLALLEFDIKNGKSIVKALKIAMPICAILFTCSQCGYRFQLIRLINSVISVNLVLYVITRKDNWVTSKIFSNKVFISLGKISYGIYIIHFILPIFWIRLINFSQSYINISENTKRFLIYPPSGYLIELILLLALSYISYYYFEVKFLKLKQNFIIKKPSPELGND